MIKVQPRITRISQILFFSTDVSRRSVGEGGSPITENSVRRSEPCGFAVEQRERIRAFTLLELLVVIAIVAILFVLVVPAFTNIKGGNDITNAAYTISGVLEQARAYARGNNTYVWVGFYEEDVSHSSTSPATAGVGRVVISVVASKDGTIVYNPNSLATIDPTRLAQLGKVTKIENIHLATFTDGTGAGSTFDTR